MEGEGEYKVYHEMEGIILMKLNIKCNENMPKKEFAIVVIHFYKNIFYCKRLELDLITEVT